jgi:signal transduction histidine kinase
VGIPPDQLPHIFERFYRGDPARSRGESSDGNADGAGLGLSIARWIADVHGAEIAVDSEPRRGTRIRVQFPAPTPASSKA